MISVNSIALQILRADRTPSASTAEQQPAGRDLIAVANNLNKASDRPGADATEDIFSIHHIDANQLKIRLFERVGEQFGIDMDDHESLASYGEAIREAVALLRQYPGGYIQLEEIEKKLGLNELGVSIDTVINAIIDPDGRHDDKLEEALKRKTGEDVKEGKKSDPAVILDAIRIDENGIYGY